MLIAPLGVGKTGVASKGTSLGQQDADPFCKQLLEGLPVVENSQGFSRTFMVVLGGDFHIISFEVRGWF